MSKAAEVARLMTEEDFFDTVEKVLATPTPTQHGTHHGTMQMTTTATATAAAAAAGYSPRSPSTSPPPAAQMMAHVAHPLAPLTFADIQASCGNTLSSHSSQQQMTTMPMSMPMQAHQSHQQQQIAPNSAMAAMFLQMASAMMSGQFPIGMSMNMGGMPMMQTLIPSPPQSQSQSQSQSPPPPPPSLGSVSYAPQIPTHHNTSSTTAGGMFQFRCSQCRGTWKRRLATGQSPYHPCRDCRVTAFGQPISSGGNGGGHGGGGGSYSSMAAGTPRNSFGTTGTHHHSHHSTFHQNTSTGPRLAYERLPAQTAELLQAPLISVTNEWARSVDPLTTPAQTTTLVKVVPLPTESVMNNDNNGNNAAKKDLPSSPTAPAQTTIQPAHSVVVQKLKKNSIKIKTKTKTNVSGNTMRTENIPTIVDVSQALPLPPEPDATMTVAPLAAGTKRKQVRFSSPVAQYDQTPPPQLNAVKRIRTSASNLAVGDIDTASSTDTRTVVIAVPSQKCKPQPPIPRSLATTTITTRPATLLVDRPTTTNVVAPQIERKIKKHATTTTTRTPAVTTTSENVNVAVVVAGKKRDVKGPMTDESVKEDVQVVRYARFKTLSLFRLPTPLVVTKR